MKRLAILLSAFVTLSAVLACSGGGGGGGYSSNSYYYYCHHCKNKLQWEDEETSWKCPNCSGINIRINCYQCGTGQMISGWGAFNCTSCGRRAGCAQCGNCGKAKRTDGDNTGSVCQHCGGQ